MDFKWYSINIWHNKIIKDDDRRLVVNGNCEHERFKATTRVFQSACSHSGPLLKGDETCWHLVFFLVSMQGFRTIDVLVNIRALSRNRDNKL